jgi:4-carboxymuconolactone decarboxylase
MKSRLTLPLPEQMNDEQRAIYAYVLSTLGNVSGPLLAWLLSPELAGPAQALGAFCRYRTSLDLQESELLILTVAAHYRCASEREIHEPIASETGLADDVLLALRRREAPPVKTQRLCLLAELSRTLCEEKTLYAAL